ncbi:hypothetical protein OsJ_10228 [Oryza sativa Japonica Group]|nr:hypothetical protein OsJ_10228 [Oryza sativa Japonica Group]
MSGRERESSRSGWRMLMDEAKESKRPSMPIRRRRPVVLEAPLTQQQGRGAAKQVERLSIGDIQRLEWKALEAKIQCEIHVAPWCLH